MPSVCFTLPLLPLLLQVGCAPKGGDTSHDTVAPGDTGPYEDTSAPGDTGLPAEGGILPAWDAADFQQVWEVGPGLDYEDPCDCPWEALQPSTLVRVHGREAPYACKWAMDVVASEDAPVVVLGVVSDGFAAVISGDGARTPQGLDFWSEDRGVIKVGGTSFPGPDDPPAWIWIQGLEIRAAHPDYAFTDDQGASASYSDNAAAIFLEEGQELHVVGNTLVDSGNGLFVASSSSDAYVVANYLYGNGIVGGACSHNSYTEASGIVFEYNRYGPLREGAEGNNLKDRSTGTVIRYNWIESGNRQLDLVESSNDAFVQDPAYRQTFVYGNLLVEPEDAGNSQVVHYGGDGGDTSRYRAGTLYFYHNTVLTTRSGNTTLLRLSTDSESADVRGNIVFASAGGDLLAIYAGAGGVTLQDNWLPTGWVPTHEAQQTGSVADLGNVEGDAPGLVDWSALDLHLTEGSPCLGAAGEPSAAVSQNPLDMEYVEHQGGRARSSWADMGAFEG